MARAMLLWLLLLAVTGACYWAFRDFLTFFVWVVMVCLVSSLLHFEQRYR